MTYQTDTSILENACGLHDFLVKGTLKILFQKLEWDFVCLNLSDKHHFVRFRNRHFRLQTSFPKKKNPNSGIIFLRCNSPLMPI